jgi:hypothetical protein
MKRIEAVVKRANLNHFYHCAETLGIFGFDLCEYRESGTGSSGDRDRIRSQASALTSGKSRLQVDFAVLDIDAKDTVHAVLEQAHPDSIAIFTLDP